MEKEINVPINEDDVSNLKIGDVINLTGNVLTARDQAHKRILEESAPIDIEGAAIFHAGPIITEENDNYKMVAIGPTTSMRMNPYQSDIIEMGAKIIIGKGGMNDDVRKSLVENNAVYRHNSYGPTFGGGHDLYLADQCRSNTSSYCSKSNYNTGNTNVLGVNGSTSFQVSNYEVYQAIYE